MSENELGVFLRSRREALAPTSVGLPAGRRRRTPGLRRGELATLAGVSVEYLARLEQGRDRHPSAQVVGALADALRLTDTDRLHLRRIAKAQDGTPCLIVEPPATTIGPSTRMVLDRLEPAPAVVVNRLTDVLAHTEGFRLLAEPIGLLGPSALPAPNLVRHVFADPRAREVYPDWEAVADRRVADLRLALHGSDPYVIALLDELRLSARATRPAPLATAPETVDHPEAGVLHLRPETMTFPDSDDLRLVLYLPDDEDTATRLDRLLRTGPRAVGTLRRDTSASGFSDAGPRATVDTRYRVANQRTTNP